MKGDQGPGLACVWVVLAVFRHILIIKHMLTCFDLGLAPIDWLILTGFDNKDNASSSRRTKLDTELDETKIIVEKWNRS